MNEEQKQSINWAVMHLAIGMVITWGLLELVVWEGREQRLDGALDNLHMENVMYKERVRFLEEDLRALRAENDRLSLWLQTKPDTIPYYETQLVKLKKDNRALEDKIALFQKKVTPKGWTAIGESVKPEPKRKKKEKYAHLEKIRAGEFFEDGRTGLRFALDKVNKDFTIEITVNMPGQSKRQMIGVKAGAGWPFSHKGAQYLLVVRKVDWFSGAAEVEVIQVSGG